MAARALQDNARLLVAACQQETAGSVLHPIASMIRRELGLAGLAGEKAKEIVSATLMPLGGDEATSHAVATLLGFAGPEGAALLSTSVNRNQAFALIAEWIVAADNRPTLLVVEDLHLADPSTLQFLGELTDHVAGHDAYSWEPCVPAPRRYWIIAAMPSPCTSGGCRIWRSRA